MEWIEVLRAPAGRLSAITAAEDRSVEPYSGVNAD